jgi:hypothetical protein
MIFVPHNPQPLILSIFTQQTGCLNVREKTLKQSNGQSFFGVSGSTEDPKTHDNLRACAGRPAAPVSSALP